MAPLLSAKALLRLDSVLTRLNLLLASPTGTDALLSTLTYTLHLLHAVLARITTARLHRATQHVIAKFTAAAPDALLPGETLVATLAPARTSRLYRAQSRAAALAALIDDFRIFARLSALLPLYLSIRKAFASYLSKSPRTSKTSRPSETTSPSEITRPSEDSSAEDSLLRPLAGLQLALCTVFTGLENAAYLASKGVLLDWTPNRIARAYVWSSRLWVAYVLAGLVRLVRERQLWDSLPQSPASNAKTSSTPLTTENNADQHPAFEKTVGSDDKAVKAAASTRRAVEAKWWRDVYANLAWLPLTAHWSVDEGLMGEASVALLGLVPGVLSLREAWQAAI